MIIRRQKRGNRGSRRADVAAIRDAIKDDRCWVKLGIVTKFDDQQSHYDIDTNGTPPDILVDVELMPDGEHMLCRLGSAGGGPNRGLWAIPPIGTEVVVVWGDGLFDSPPMIVSTLASGITPAELAEDTALLIAPNVLINGHGGSVNVISSDQIVLNPSNIVKLGDTEGTQKTIRGEAYRAAEDTLFSALVAAITSVISPTDAATLTAAVTAFEAAASSFLTTKVEVK